MMFSHLALSFLIMSLRSYIYIYLSPSIVACTVAFHMQQRHLPYTVLRCREGYIAYRHPKHTDRHRSWPLRINCVCRATLVVNDKSATVHNSIVLKTHTEHNIVFQKSSCIHVYSPQICNSRNVGTASGAMCIFESNKHKGTDHPQHRHMHKTQHTLAVRPFARLNLTCTCTNSREQRHIILIYCACV